MGRLVEIWRDRPGALRRLRDYASSGELDVQIEVPHDFGILFPADWDGSEDEGGLTGWQRKTDEAVCSLAATMYELPTDEIAMRVFEADAEATAAGIIDPRLTPRLAQLLAAENKQPDIILAKLEQLGAAGHWSSSGPPVIGAARGRRSSDAAVPRTRRRPEAGGLGSYSRATNRR